MLPTTMTPELGNALIVIDALVFGVFLLVIGASKIGAGSSRLAKLLRAIPFVERFKLWRAAGKSQ